MKYSPDTVDSSRTLVTIPSSISTVVPSASDSVKGILSGKSFSSDNAFETSEDLDVLREIYLVYEDAVPKIAPYWFDCFDAKELGLALKDKDYGEVFLSKKNIVYGIDRVVAILANGNGYVWHEINECGDKLYDGSPVSNECPEKD